MIFSYMKKCFSSWMQKREREKEIRKQYKALMKMTTELSKNLKRAEMQEDERMKNKKSKYTLISVFPTKEIMERAFNVARDV